ncbi:MAG: Phage integrase, N-terminal SAM-like domain [Acidobacteriaceae bacterium]|nr:Phage integrase, N-terminal SAM-like domain [Acidobacteriaceae bacterium]
MNPTALIPVKQPGDLREDRVGQLVQRVLDGVPSDETRRAYSHALEMFLAFCEREGNPTLSAELVSSYRVSLVGEGKSSSTVGVHLAAIKALTRVSRCTQIAILVGALGILHSKRGFRSVFVLKSRTECRGPEATWNQFSGSCWRGLRRDTAGAGKAQFGSIAFKPRTNFLGNFVRDLTTNVRDFSAMTLQ